jgi:hypothetical protein
MIPVYWDNAKSASGPGLGALSASNSGIDAILNSYGNITDYYKPEIRTHITYDGTGTAHACGLCLQVRNSGRGRTTGTFL